MDDHRREPKPKVMSANKSTAGRIPSTCFTCKNALGDTACYRQPVLLMCDCMIALCFGCAGNQIGKQRETFTDLTNTCIECPLCDSQVCLHDMIQDERAFQRSMEEACTVQDQLIGDAMARFGIVTVDRSVFKTLIQKHFSNEEYTARHCYLTEMELTSLAVVKLRVARLEQHWQEMDNAINNSNDEDDHDAMTANDETGEGYRRSAAPAAKKKTDRHKLIEDTDLCLGPLGEVVSCLKEDNFLELLLRIGNQIKDEEVVIDLTCALCGEWFTGDSHSSTCPVFVSCNCKDVRLCQSCVLNSIRNSPRTFHTDFQCPFCKVHPPFLIDAPKDIPRRRRAAASETKKGRHTDDKNSREASYQCYQTIKDAEKELIIDGALHFEMTRAEGRRIYSEKEKPFQLKSELYQRYVSCNLPGIPDWNHWDASMKHVPPAADGVLQWADRITLGEYYLLTEKESVDLKLAQLEQQRQLGLDELPLGPLEYLILRKHKWWKAFYENGLKRLRGSSGNHDIRSHDRIATGPDRTREEKVRNDLWKDYIIEFADSPEEATQIMCNLFSPPLLGINQLTEEEEEVEDIVVLSASDRRIASREGLSAVSPVEDVVSIDKTKTAVVSTSDDEKGERVNGRSAVGATAAGSLISSKNGGYSKHHNAGKGDGGSAEGATAGSLISSKNGDYSKHHNAGKGGGGGGDNGREEEEEEENKKEDTQIKKSRVKEEEGEEEDDEDDDDEKDKEKGEEDDDDDEDVELTAEEIDAMKKHELALELEARRREEDQLKYNLKSFAVSSRKFQRYTMLLEVPNYDHSKTETLCKDPEEEGNTRRSSDMAHMRVGVKLPGRYTEQYVNVGVMNDSITLKELVSVIKSEIGFKFPVVEYCKFGQNHAHLANKKSLAHYRIPLGSTVRFHPFTGSKTPQQKVYVRRNQNRLTSSEAAKEYVRVEKPEILRRQQLRENEVREKGYGYSIDHNPGVLCGSDASGAGAGACSLDYSRTSASNGGRSASSADNNSGTADDNTLAPPRSVLDTYQPALPKVRDWYEDQMEAEAERKLSKKQKRGPKRRVKGKRKVSSSDDDDDDDDVGDEKGDEYHATRKRKQTTKFFEYRSDGPVEHLFVPLPEVAARPQEGTSSGDSTKSCVDDVGSTSSSTRRTTSSSQQDAPRQSYNSTAADDSTYNYNNSDSTCNNNHSYREYGNTNNNNYYSYAASNSTNYNRSSNSRNNDRRSIYGDSGAGRGGDRNREEADVVNSGGCFGGSSYGKRVADDADRYHHSYRESSSSSSSGNNRPYKYNRERGHYNSSERSYDCDYDYDRLDTNRRSADNGRLHDDSHYHRHNRYNADSSSSSRAIPPTTSRNNCHRYDTVPDGDHKYYLKNGDYNPYHDRDYKK